MTQHDDDGRWVAAQRLADRARRMGEQHARPVEPVMPEIPETTAERGGVEYEQPTLIPDDAPMMGLDAPVMNPAASARARDEGIAQVESGASPEWKVAALAAVHQVALAKAELIPDDVWETGLPMPTEGRALGPVMLKAARNGWIERTDRVIHTAQVKSHRRGVTVWRSLIHDGS